ncbi:MAG: bacteriocin [Bacteroidaceae bacterium]|nr:bacteriocin [Bacteroidaceae bacterium]
MKKLSKITLAKAYDVLSENEMKKVVGGMGSGSSSGSPVALVNCSTLAGHECEGRCILNSTTLGTCRFQHHGLDTGCYCEKY